MPGAIIPTAVTMRRRDGRESLSSVNHADARARLRLGSSKNHHDLSPPSDIPWRKDRKRSMSSMRACYGAEQPSGAPAPSR